MWQVGTASTHARFLEALGSGHGYVGRVEAWFDGVRIGDVEFQDGRVRCSSRARERRSLEISVAESSWPTNPDDILSPYGVWLRAYVTVTMGEYSFPEIPVFAGKLSTVARMRWSGMLRVSAVDPMWQVNREPFDTPRQPSAGMSIPDTIRALLLEVFDESGLQDLSGSGATVPAGTVWDTAPGARGKAIDELAASIGAEIFAMPTSVSPGGHFVLRPVPSLAGTVAWTLPDGAASVVESDQQSQSGLSVVNRWVVTSERMSEVAPVRAVVSNDDSASPTRYGGPMGRLTSFYSSPLISTEEQARTAGAAKLARSLGLARVRQLTVIANPALEAGDVLAVSVDGEQVEHHIVDEFELPLTATSASMSISSRSTVAET